MSYNSMVAVCDILGYGDLVKSSSLMELKDFHMENIKNIMRSAISHFGENTESPTPKEAFLNNLVGHTVFSDTIILFSLNDDHDGYQNVLDAVYRLICVPMFHPFYKYRVGISYGEFYHNPKENLYIGKALVEANDLEKVQQWSGAALSETAANKIKEEFPGKSMLVEYDAPIRLSSGSTHRKYSVVNWTLATHSVKLENHNWMYREENGSEVHSYKDKDVEQKILNTEKFHSDICVQCKAARSKRSNK